MRVDYSDQDPQQRRPDRGPARAACARRLAPRLPRLVEGHGAGRLPGGAGLSAHRLSRSTRRAGPSSITCGCRTIAGASCLAPAEENRKVPFGRPFRRARMAGSAGRISRHAAPAGRDPGRHRTGLGRAAAPSRQDRAVALRHAQPVPGQRRGRPSSVGDGLPAAQIFRARRARGSRGIVAAPLRQRGLAAHARRLQ